MYHSEMPSFLWEMAGTPVFLRLEDVGMNCGCEYTGFPLFRKLAGYSRYDHSVGVGLIVWHFTCDPAQAAAGLLHDVATPVFAHVVDFLRGDYLVQESTENDTEDRIRSSPELCGILSGLSLPVEAVSNYHLYPVADNDTPHLSADRLEYTLGNLLNFGFSEKGTVKAYYDDLTIDINECGEPELMFRTRDTALAFARDALRCSRVYVAKEDRYAMQMLAELLGDAIRAGILAEPDLDRTESVVIEKLRSIDTFSHRWERFCAYREIVTADAPGPEPGWRQIRAKRRYIDPAVAGQGRVSALFPAFGEKLTSFLSESFDPWLLGV